MIALPKPGFLPIHIATTPSPSDPPGFEKWLDLQRLFSGLLPRCPAQRKDLTVVLTACLISGLGG